MRTMLIAIAVLALAAVVPGVADADYATYGPCTLYGANVSPGHVHVCVNLDPVFDILERPLPILV